VRFFSQRFIALLRGLTSHLPLTFLLSFFYRSTWNTFGGSVSDALLRESADTMISSGLFAAG
jgi:hypothetical protein